MIIFKNTTTAWKMSKYEVFSGPYFPVFGLNTEIYGVNLHFWALFTQHTVLPKTTIPILLYLPWNIRQFSKTLKQSRSVCGWHICLVIWKCIVSREKWFINKRTPTFHDSMCQLTKQGKCFKAESWQGFYNLLVGNLSRWKLSKFLDLLSSKLFEGVIKSVISKLQ